MLDDMRLSFPGKSAAGSVSRDIQCTGNLFVRHLFFSMYILTYGNRQFVVRVTYGNNRFSAHGNGRLHDYWIANSRTRV